MRLHFSVGIIIALWAVLLPPIGHAQTGFGLTLETNKPKYHSGEPVHITLEVFNRTTSPIIFHFGNGQRYDFILEDDQGKAIWRWSEGRMFTQELGSETLLAENPRLIYQEACSKKLRPGSYTVRGLLTDMEWHLSAETRIVVE